MPQLNPTPWFMVFTLIWVFLIMFFTKTLNNNPPSQPHNVMSNLVTTTESDHDFKLLWSI